MTAYLSSSHTVLGIDLLNGVLVSMCRTGSNRTAIHSTPPAGMRIPFEAIASGFAEPLHYNDHVVLHQSVSAKWNRGKLDLPSNTSGPETNDMRAQRRQRGHERHASVANPGTWPCLVISDHLITVCPMQSISRDATTGPMLHGFANDTRGHHVGYGQRHTTVFDVRKMRLIGRRTLRPVLLVRR